MTLSAVEQYLLELINRARLDPLAEAGRYNIDLNASLPKGTLTESSKQVLAPNQILEDAASAHSLWMIQTDIFSHSGTNNSQPWDRAASKGYSYTTIGENIAWSGTTAASFDLVEAIESHHELLFRSAGHRKNLLSDSFREVGLGRETGDFSSNGVTYNASLLTQVFGTSGTKAFITGVAYSDNDQDKFYSVGEGVGGIGFSANGLTEATSAAGGYAIGLVKKADTLVTGFIGTKSFTVSVDLSDKNVKLDIVDGNTFATSGNIELVSGIHDAKLLGVEALSLTGSDFSNALLGNRGSNLINGMAGNDYLRGMGGKDRLEGSNGNDRLIGDSGRDALFGGNGDDQLFGGSGDDRLSGDAGNDILTGGSGADTFVFRPQGGADVILDFSLEQSDRLILSPNYWRGVEMTSSNVIDAHARIVDGDVLFDFGSLGSVRIDGVNSLAWLSSAVFLD